jgi:hypothetical protein
MRAECSAACSDAACFEVPRGQELTCGGSKGKAAGQLPELTMLAS